MPGPKSKTTVDWRKNVAERLGQTRQRRTGRRKYPYLVHLPGALSWMALIAQAAERAGLNRSAWMRRAISVALARQLGLDIHDVLAQTPSHKGVGHDGRKYVGDFDSGEGIEYFDPPPCRSDCPKR